MNPFVKMVYEALLQKAELERKLVNVVKKQCPNCKSTLIDIQATGKAGCAYCYEEFATEFDYLVGLVQNGATTHVGKAPKFKHNESLFGFLEEALSSKIKTAVAKEDYSEAAVLKKKTEELEVFKSEKKEIVKFMKRALEFGEYEGIAAGKEKIDDLYRRARTQFNLYIP